MSQVIRQEALTRLLWEKGIFTKDEFMEMVRAVDREMKLKRKLESGEKMQTVCKIDGISLVSSFLNSST